MPSRYSIGLATVIMLVLLRLNVGWHFFSEGVKHYTDPHWTSEPTLRSAKGPFASWYQTHLPDFHGFEEIVHGPQSESESHAAGKWNEQIQADWNDHLAKFIAHYDLTDAQKDRLKQLLAQYQTKLRDWSKDNNEAIATHIHQWQRRETTSEQPSAGMPFQKKRLAGSHSQLVGEANGWLAQLKTMEADYQTALRGVLTSEQRDEPALAQPVNSIQRIDRVMTYGILGIGLLLILGLFTRVACVAGAAFLLSVVMMQPFWVSDALPTYNQFVEMFALLTLATTPVGQWGGLDFFVRRLWAGQASTPVVSRAPAGGKSPSLAS